MQKYKDELSINGDLSYLNLDWKPVPVISKFVDILVNGISEKKYEVKAFSQDPESITWWMSSERAAAEKGQTVCACGFECNSTMSGDNQMNLKG